MSNLDPPISQCQFEDREKVEQQRKSIQLKQKPTQATNSTTTTIAPKHLYNATL